jgi:hypothetical protein
MKLSNLNFNFLNKNVIDFFHFKRIEINLQTVTREQAGQFPDEKHFNTTVKMV